MYLSAQQQHFYYAPNMDYVTWDWDAFDENTFTTQGVMPWAIFRRGIFWQKNIIDIYYTNVNVSLP